MLYIYVNRSSNKNKPIKIKYVSYMQKNIVLTSSLSISFQNITLSIEIKCRSISCRFYLADDFIILKGKHLTFKRGN